MIITKHEKNQLKQGLKKQATGYHWLPDRNKWKVSFRINGKVCYGGMFKTEQEAIARVISKREALKHAY